MAGRASVRQRDGQLGLAATVSCCETDSAPRVICGQSMTGTGSPDVFARATTHSTSCQGRDGYMGATRTSVGLFRRRSVLPCDGQRKLERITERLCLKLFVGQRL